MSIPAAWPQVLDFFGTPLAIEPSTGQLSSGAGLLPIRQFDRGEPAIPGMHGENLAGEGSATAP